MSKRRSINKQFLLKYFQRTNAFFCRSVVQDQQLKKLHHCWFLTLYVGWKSRDLSEYLKKKSILCSAQEKPELVLKPWWCLLHTVNVNGLVLSVLPCRYHLARGVYPVSSPLHQPGPSSDLRLRSPALYHVQR